MTIKFEAGQTYCTRSICDYDCIFSFGIISRTEKTVTILTHGKTKACWITVRDGVETIKLHGSYSMACVLSATDTSAKMQAELDRAAALAAERVEAAKAKRDGMVALVVAEATGATFH